MEFTFSRGQREFLAEEFKKQISDYSTIWAAMGNELRGLCLDCLNFFCRTTTQAPEITKSKGKQIGVKSVPQPDIYTFVFAFKIPSGGNPSYNLKIHVNADEWERRK